MAGFLAWIWETGNSLQNRPLSWLSHPSTTQMFFEVVPSPAKEHGHLELEPEGRAGRGRTAPTQPLCIVPISRPRLLWNKWEQRGRRNACSPRKGEWWEEAEWPRPPSLWLACIKSPNSGVKQVLVSALALLFRSLQSSRPLTSVISNCVVVGKVGAGVQWPGFTSEPRDPSHSL